MDIQKSHMKQVKQSFGQMTTTKTTFFPPPEKVNVVVVTQQSLSLCNLAEKKKSATEFAISVLLLLRRARPSKKDRIDV